MHDLYRLVRPGSRPGSDRSPIGVGLECSWGLPGGCPAGAAASRALLPSNPRGIRPEALELVVLALLGDEDVDDEVAEVEKDPAPVRASFATDGAGAAFPENAAPRSRVVQRLAT